MSTSVRQAYVYAMNESLIHRGPDDGGSFSSDSGTIAMRRLSIIDQENGGQPLFNEKRDKCIVFNGEIYNFPQLKKELQSRGYRFRTNSDTEVLIYLYEAFDVNMLPMLKGMFSFCIHDIKRNLYFLARDAFGEKPLYYHWENQIFSFSSEIKSLLKHSNIDRRLNHTALSYYFRTSLIPEPISFFKGIKSLSAGEYLQISESKLEIATYFKPTYTSDPTIHDEEEAVELIRPLLLNAVKRQTISDVPIGAFLSGGIDSSTIVALLQQKSHQPIKTFNVRFENESYDESAIAKKVATFCGTDHHEIFIPDFDFDPTLFWDLIDHFGLPFRDSSAIPSFLISREISKHVKVALSGDGGDELFGGYDLFQWYQKIIRFRNTTPRPFRSIMNSGLGVAQQLPFLDQFSSIRKMKRGVSTSLMPLRDIPISLNELFDETQFDAMMRNHSMDDQFKFPLLKDYPEDYDKWSPIRKIMYYRLVHTLPSNMLIKVDRMSMANSLEVRTPFLDLDLFAISTQLSDNLLVNEGKGKYILRKIMEKSLPQEVFNHPKQGFNIPLYRYKNDAFKELAHQLLFEDNPWPDLLPKDQLKAIYKRGIETNKSDANKTVFKTAHQLWMLMQLFGWAKRFNVQS